MDTYDPAAWYWIVGGDTSKVYSGAAGAYVQPSNAGYVTWLARGNTATSIASEAELGEVLAQYQLRPTPTAVLDGYQDAHSRKLTIEIVAKVLFAYANEIRALKGQAPINANQFRQYVKDLM